MGHQELVEGQLILNVVDGYTRLKNAFLKHFEQDVLLQINEYSQSSIAFLKLFENSSLQNCHENF